MTLSLLRRVAVATLLGLAGSTLHAQQSTVIHAETRVVLVDAIVTVKNGSYVTDLTQNDFHVFQDNKEQAIKSFSLEGTSKAAEPRSLVLFFDKASMEIRDQILARQAASRFIDAEAGPNRRMAVVTFDGSLRVAQTFTDNAGRLKDALPAPQSNSRTEEKTRPGLPVNVVNSATGDLGARNMIRSLRDLGRSLGVLPGRKIVVLFSGGVPSSSDQRSALADVIEACNRSGVAIYPADVRSVSVQTDQGTTPALPADRHPTRATGGLRGGPQPQGDSDNLGDAQNSGAGSQQILFGLANGTGGFVILNSNDLLNGLQTIAAEQDQYYVLTFSPPESKDGSCHALRVKVDRKATTIRARNSYCTEKPLDLLAGTTTGKELENRATGSQTGNISASIELPYFYNSATVARVNLAMEIAPDSLKFENQKGKLHAEISLLGIASTADGTVGARFSDALKMDFDNQAQMEKWKTRPLHYEKEFKIAPGVYSFTLVFSSGGANFGKVALPLAVDPRKAGELALSSLVISNELHPATDLGLGLDVGLMGDRTALITDGMQVVPSGSNQLNRSEPAFFYLEAYEQNVESMVVRARVLDRKTNEPKWDSGVFKMSGPHQGGAIPINTLAPGTYQLEVIVGNPGDKQIKRTADLEIK
jgi:VWFA-related protein